LVWCGEIENEIIGELLDMEPDDKMCPNGRIVGYGT